LKLCFQFAIVNLEKIAMLPIMRHKYTPNANRQPAPNLLMQERQLRAKLGQTVDRQFGIFIVSLMALAGSVATTVSSYQQYSIVTEKELRFGVLTSQIQYYDEVLTMSARMAASTGDKNWERRYNEFVPKLDEDIQELTALPIQEFKLTNQHRAKSVEEANQQLIAIETQALEMVNRGEGKTALTLLLSPEYQKLKQIYAEGARTTQRLIGTQINQDKLDARNRSYWGLGITGGIAIGILGLTTRSLRSQRRATLKQQEQNEQLQESQVALQQLNSDLEAKGQQLELQSQQLAEQEEALRVENEFLQEDIAHLLDVVSAVEEGDFTIQAQVNDRITGLVADTLNRLIEQLGRVLGEVVNASTQMTLTSTDLEALAKNVASYASQQEQGASQVLGLTKQVQTSTQASVKQVERTGQSLLRMNQLVTQGRGELESMTQGIEVLQGGTDRIVQQMKTLGEFVGLADQFVQEQNQIVSLTQVLSLNATLVAARASEQRDPRQFSTVAREFEQIAAQVGNLAQQTGDGLAMLQQRTATIYSAVSAIDTDVQSLGNLVQGFTQGVLSSNNSFAALQTVAGGVVAASETVTRSNQEIVEAAQRTAFSMGQMAQTAKQTVALTQNAEERTQSMEELAQQLFERMQFFRLTDSDTPADRADPNSPNPSLDYQTELTSNVDLTWADPQKPLIEESLPERVSLATLFDEVEAPEPLAETVVAEAESTMSEGFLAEELIAEELIPREMISEELISAQELIPEELIAKELQSSELATADLIPEDVEDISAVSV
jgi:methyl-accepting chemotaxis protein PixJ